jgi:potassium-transporting ATPase KdpC subunit
MTTLTAQLRPALVALLLLTLITGVAYPLLVTGVALVAFPAQAGGSMILGESGELRGSALVGQPFDDPRYFWGRLSATAPAPYTALNREAGTGSAGSNYGPLNPALQDAARARIAALQAADPLAALPVPVDLVTASASGLDPHISPAAAEYQVRRVAAARGIPEGQVRALVVQYTEGRDLGVLGEPRVHVLRLNLALDRIR